MAGVGHDGESGMPFRARNHTGWRLSLTIKIANIWTKFTRFSHCLSRHATSCNNHDNIEPQIEDAPVGYPRFAALIAAHPSFHICRRYGTVRARLLLLKQDRVRILEQQLEKVDREESQKPFLSSSRHDANAQRKRTLADLDVALAEYGRRPVNTPFNILRRSVSDRLGGTDSLVQRNQRMLDYRLAPDRAVLNLVEWTRNNACIARDETAYLGRVGDLISVATPSDDALERVEEALEDGFVRFRRSHRKDPRLSVSRDPFVWIWTGKRLRRFAGVVAACLICMLMLIPVLAVNAASGTALRMTFIVLATMMFVLAVSSFTKAKSSELFIAGATYLTVLVVFVANSNTMSASG